jgi:hypothetical protein
MQLPGKQRWVAGVLVSRPKAGMTRVQLAAGPGDAAATDLPTECVRLAAVETAGLGAGTKGGPSGSDVPDSTLLRRRGVCGTEVPPAAALGLVHMFCGATAGRELIDTVCAAAEDILASPSQVAQWQLSVTLPHDVVVHGLSTRPGTGSNKPPVGRALSPQTAVARAAASLPPPGFPRVAMPSWASGLGLLELFRAAGFCVVAPAPEGGVGGGLPRPGDTVCLRFGGGVSTDWKAVPHGVLVELAVCVQMMRVS